MTRFSLEKRLPRYYLVYEEVHKNPFVPIYQITKRTGIARSTVSRYLEEMYERSILKGPLLFLNPAENYHEYVAFVKFENPQRIQRLYVPGSEGGNLRFKCHLLGLGNLCRENEEFFKSTRRENLLI